MKKIIITSILLPLLAMKCYKKEGPNCHKEVVFKNKSDFTLILGQVYKAGDKNCGFFMSEVKAGEDYVMREDNCWEDIPTAEVYIISPERFQPQGYYSCDSIAIKNKVLKHYVLTLDYLHQHNWTILYE